VLPVVTALAAAGAVVSIDTMRASTAAAAIAAGARLVNDVSGGQADPDLPRLVAEARVPYVVMHWRAHADRMQQHADYDDVVADVRAELLRRVDTIVAAGVDLDQLVLDPGLGFAKLPAHNWALLAHLDELIALGRPVLVGASRKSFLGELLGAGSTPRPTAATTVIAALAGAWGVRVHAVRASADAVRVVARLKADQDAGRT
jgi:dihydropteroate synthase